MRAPSVCSPRRLAAMRLKLVLADLAGEALDRAAAAATLAAGGSADALTAVAPR